MSKYSIKIQFDEQARTSDSDNKICGIVRIAVLKECTCRKLVLNWDCRNHENDERKKGNSIQITLTKWEKWEANQTMDYRFEFDFNSFRSQLDTACHWYVRPEVYLTATSKPDVSVGWFAADNDSPEQAREATGLISQEKLDVDGDGLTSVRWQKAVVASHLEPEAGFRSHEDAGSEIAELDAVEEDERDVELLIDEVIVKPSASTRFSITISFDNNNRNYRIGEQIAGKIVVVPDQDYTAVSLELKYQWRTHGRIEQEKGETIGIVIAEADSWIAGHKYTYPFSYIIEDGPVSYRGHNQNLDWYAWPELESLPEPSVNWRGKDTEFMLLPSDFSLAVRQEKEMEIPPLVAHIIWPIGLIILPLACRLTYTNFLSYSGMDDLTFGQQILRWTPVIFVTAVALASYKAIKTSYTALRYQFAEMRLGPVNVQIDASPDRRSIRGRVGFHARQNVYVKAIELSLKVREITKYQEGTRTVTKKRLLHHSSAIKALNRHIEVNDSFERETGLPVPDGLPMSQYRSSRTINWRLELRIVIKGWFNWRREYPVTVSR